MSTINLTNSSAAQPVIIKAGQYLLATAGLSAADAVTVTLYLNVGDAKGAPLTDAVFTEAGAKVVWLPNCTAYIETDAPPPVDGFGVALAELSTKLDDG